MTSRYRNAIQKAVLGIAVLCLWQLIASLRIVKPLFLPSPVDVLGAFGRTWPEIGGHILATFTRALAAIVIGISLGLFAGLAIVRSKAGAVVDELVESLRPVPPLIAVPLVILWTGGGWIPQIVLTGLGCAVILAVDVAVASRNLNPIYIRAARSLGATESTVTRRILLPGIQPAIAGTLRIVTVFAFTLSIGFEFTAQEGLGYLANRARRTLETPTIILAMLLVALMARIFDYVVHRATKRICRWNPDSQSELQEARRRV
jgi:taurine transport system permease protein